MATFTSVLLMCILLPTVLCLNEVIFNLTEEELPNTYLGNVASSANLISELPNPDILQKMKYSFLNNSFVKYYSINERSSALYTARRIDRETLCAFLDPCHLPLEVIARTTSDDSVTNVYKKIQVTIHLLDANDNRPSFSVSRIQRDISEGSLIDSRIPINSAIDKDKGIFSVQNYTLDPQDSPFIVEFGEREDGSSRVELVLKKKLDRETRNQYRLTVTALDGGDPPLTGTMEVELNVLDINDNSPVFSHKIYDVTVNENVTLTSTIVTVTATDDDAGDNGRVTYKLSDNQDPKIKKLFAIDEISGNISVVESLIYEPGESYKIYIVASDHADPPLKSQAQVFVKVLDVQNETPQINVNLLSNTEVAEISENAKNNAAVAHIKVFDPDTGKNGIVNCSVQNPKFTIQRFDVREYKVVLYQSLNRESVDRYDVTVVCHDSGTPSLSASASFTVSVMDVNDNTPRFSQSTYILNVDENSEIGTSVYRVSASDYDIGKNAELVYTLQASAQQKFHINPVNGLITVAGNIDRETQGQYSFNIYATDKGITPHTGTAEVKIFVTDVNDNTPQFIKPVFEFNLIEGNSVNTKVGSLQAKDLDEGQNGIIRYSLHPNYHLGIPFEIKENGTIVASQMIDREVKGRYDFTVIAEDRGTPSLKHSAHVTVFILDINDNSPQFVFPNGHNNTLVISYQTKKNTVIGTIDARDIDDGLNSKVTYFFTNKNLTSIFQLNSLSGRLILVKTLTINDAGKYTFGVIAQDKGTPPMTNDMTMSIVITTQPLGGDVNKVSENRHYFLIAIAISCVTIVIAIVIILTICLIKRADRIKQKYHEQNKDGGHNHGDSRLDTRKKVSFSVDERDLNSMPIRNNSEHLYPQITIPSSIQVTLKGSPEKSEADSGQGSLDSNDRRLHQIRSLQLHQALHPNDVISSSPRRPVTQMSPGGVMMKQDDNHSDLSGEATTSDSGRGGSEDDLNTSCMLSSFSGDFDSMKPHNRGKPQSYTKSNPRSSHIHEDLFPLRHHDYIQKDFGNPPGLSPMSYADRFFNFESTQDGISAIKNGGISPNGSSCMFGGNDDSTTTSGSYILEDVDEYVDVVRPARQCIV